MLLAFKIMKNTHNLQVLNYAYRSDQGFETSKKV